VTKPNDIGPTAAKPVARGEEGAPTSRMGHARQQPGHEKPEQRTDIAATKPKRQAVRLQPSGSRERAAAKPVARGDESVPTSRMRHALQQPGHQKAEQHTDIAASKPTRQAVRLQPSGGRERAAAKPVARGDEAVPTSRMGHALQQPGHQKAEQHTDISASKPTHQAVRLQPSGSRERAAAKPVARGDEAVPTSRMGHALQQPGRQKAEQHTDIAATKPTRQAVRRQPSGSRENDPC